MKITSAKRDDILKRQQENEAKFQERDSVYQEQRDKYYKENYNQIKKFENILNKYIGKYIEPLEIDLDIQKEYNYHADSEYYEVRIRSHEHSKFGDNSALAWNYHVTLDDNGDVEKETGSWSGLKASTPEQISDLKLTIECLETLNSIDWKSIMDSITPPTYSDYVTENNPKSEYQTTKSQLDKELIESDIEDIIGTDNVVECKGAAFEYRANVYVKIFRETPDYFEVSEAPKGYFDNDRYTDEDIRRMFSGFKHKIRKDKFYSSLIKPLNIRQLD